MCNLLHLLLWKRIQYIGAVVPFNQCAWHQIRRLTPSALSLQKPRFAALRHSIVPSYIKDDALPSDQPQKT
jgi:hypothetical protein